MSPANAPFANMDAASERKFRIYDINENWTALQLGHAVTTAL